jgi:hypothetical protein
MLLPLSASTLVLNPSSVGSSSFETPEEVFFVCSVILVLACGAWSVATRHWCHFHVHVLLIFSL